MTHEDLNPWAIYRRLSSVHYICVARFRNRGDAEGYLQILRGLVPHGKFEIVFDRRTDRGLVAS